MDNDAENVHDGRSILSFPLESACAGNLHKILRLRVFIIIVCRYEQKIRFRAYEFRDFKKRYRTAIQCTFFFLSCFGGHLSLFYSVFHDVRFRLI